MKQKLYAYLCETASRTRKKVWKLIGPLWFAIGQPHVTAWLVKVSLLKKKKEFTVRECTFFLLNILMACLVYKDMKILLIKAHSRVIPISWDLRLASTNKWRYFRWNPREIREFRDLQSRGGSKNWFISASQFFL